MKDAEKNNGYGYAGYGKKVFLAVLAILCLNLALYWNTLHHDFLKDDFRLIVENHRIKDFKSFVNSIDGKFFAFPDFPYLHYWRPLTLFTFYTDYKIWGLHPAGFHLFNILLGACNSLLVFFIFYYLFHSLGGNRSNKIPNKIPNKIRYPLVFALFFSVHPSHVEAVSWVSGRTDLLAAFFIFFAALWFIRFLQEKRRGHFILYYLLSMLFFLLGLLSKENAFLFPLLAGGLVFLFQREKTGGDDPEIKRSPLRGKPFLSLIPLVLLDLIYVVVHNAFSGVGEVAVRFSLEDIPAIFKTLGVYTKVLLVPFFPPPIFPWGNLTGEASSFIFSRPLQRGYLLW